MYPQTPKQKFMFGNSFLFGCEKGMPGVQGYVGVLLDTACSNNNRGHGPTKCLFPDGSSTPRHGGLSNFLGYFKDCNPKKIGLQLELDGL